MHDTDERRVFRPEGWVVRFGVLASVFAAAMFVIAITTGVNQDWFENIHPAGEYATMLAAQASWLRVVFTLDGFFLFSYAAFFLAYFLARKDSVPRGLLAAAAVGVLVPAALDLLENFHVLSMLHGVEAGVAPTAFEIQAQYVESAMKFGISYFGAIAFALSYPRHTAFARAVAWAVGLGYPLLGVLVFTAPQPLAFIFALVRVFCFVGAYAASAVVFRTLGKAQAERLLAAA